MIIRNWNYFEKNGTIGRLRITKGQFMTGNVMGIIAEKKPMLTSFGNVLNVKTYPFPVRIKLVDPYDGINDEIIKSQIRAAIKQLEIEGCRFIITSGGRLGLLDPLFHESDLPVMSTPLAYIEFASVSNASEKTILIWNDLSYEENRKVLHCLEVRDELLKRCVFGNLNTGTFYGKDGAIKEIGNNIGAVIWDSTERYQNYIDVDGLPVYDIIKLATHIKSAVMQVPYEGVI